MLTEIDRSWCSPELGIKKDGILLIISHQGKVLVVEEKTNKVLTGKTKGEIGVICETRDSKNEDNQETILRSIKEELGVKKEEMSYYFQKHSLNYLGIYNFIPGILAHTFTLKCTNPEGLAKKIEKNGDGEIGFVGWWTLDQLKNPQNGRKIRLGVRNVIESISNFGNF